MNYIELINEITELDLSIHSIEADNIGNYLRMTYSEASLIELIHNLKRLNQIAQYQLELARKRKWATINRKK